LARRRAIARHYDGALKHIPEIAPIGVRKDARHAYHLYVIQIDFDALGLKRKSFFRAMRNKGIGVNVHYIPVHLHPFYRRRFGTEPGLCPVAEKAYEQIVSLPIFPVMQDVDVTSVIENLVGLLG
jgi:perosamine synthetase